MIHPIIIIFSESGGNVYYTLGNLVRKCKNPGFWLVNEADTGSWLVEILRPVKGNNLGKVVSWRLKTMGTENMDLLIFNFYYSSLLSCCHSHKKMLKRKFTVVTATKKEFIILCLVRCLRKSVKHRAHNSIRFF